MLMADSGAEVIKIEPPMKGDLGRQTELAREEFRFATSSSTGERRALRSTSKTKGEGTFFERWPRKRTFFWRVSGRA